MAETLDPQLLAVFEAVAETGSATLAARRLGMTQPSVTRGVHLLEQRTGLTLFERWRHGMRLTSEGDLFAATVGRSFFGLARITHEADAIRQGLRGVVNIASLPVYAEGFVARAVGAHVQGRPDVVVRIDTPPVLTLVSELLKGGCDLAVTIGPPLEHADVITEVVGQRRMVALMRADHPLAGREALTVHDLASADLVLQPGEAPFRRMLAPAFARAGLDLRCRLEALTQRACVGVAMAAGAVTALDEDMIAGVLRERPDAAAVPIADVQPWKVSVLRRRDRQVTAQLDDLLGHLRREAAQVSAQG